MHTNKIFNYFFILNNESYCTSVLEFIFTFHSSFYPVKHLIICIYSSCILLANCTLIYLQLLSVFITELLLNYNALNISLLGQRADGDSRFALSKEDRKNFIRGSNKNRAYPRKFKYAASLEEKVCISQVERQPWVRL